MNRKGERAKNIQREGWCVPCSVCPPPVSLSVHATVMPESWVYVVGEGDGNHVGCLWNHVHMCVCVCVYAIAVNIFPTLKSNYKAGGVCFRLTQPRWQLVNFFYCLSNSDTVIMMSTLVASASSPPSLWETICCQPVANNLRQTWEQLW